jgi:NADH-quinone oxidoreductase subunit J
MTGDWLIFAALALIAVISAVMMITSRNTVYSALFLVLNFTAIAVFYLLLQAPFIAMVQITVYAGAIMVLFLFVIMLLGVEQAATSPGLPLQAPVAIVLAFALVILLGYGLLQQGDGQGGLAAVLAEGFGSPIAIGDLLFESYLIPFEATSVLLLVAIIGAIFLTARARRQAG